MSPTQPSAAPRLKLCSKIALSGLLLLSLVSMPWVASAQGNSALKIDLRSSPASVKLDGWATFIVTLKNDHANKRVVLKGEPGFSTSGGLALRLVPDANQAVGLESIGQPTTGESSVEEATARGRAVHLQPGHGLAVVRREKVRDLFPGPGRYRLVATYSNPLPAQANGNGRPDEVVGNSTTTNEIEIEVVQ